MLLPLSSLAVLLPIYSLATNLPPGYQETELVRGLSSPSALALASDGRVFIGEQGGAIRIFKEKTLLPAAFARLPADPKGERGLLGLALDPGFPKEPYLYVYYTASKPAPHNRLSRLTAKGDSMVPRSEKILAELPPAGDSVWHMGGGLAFGADGKLYLGVGDHQRPADAPDLSALNGKILRFNRDGSVPGDNPHAGSLQGLRRAIWASGLRNPFGLTLDPASGKLLIADVGDSKAEEINIGAPGGDYGWPKSEGDDPSASTIRPLYAYGRNEGACVIGGGVRDGRYYFADFSDGWIKSLDPAAKDAGASVRPFASGLSFPTSLRVAPDGAFWYLSRGEDANEAISPLGRLMRIQRADAPSAAP